MQTESIITQGAVIVGSGDLLGHWSIFKLFIITLAATVALVICRLESQGSPMRILARFNLNKLTCSSAAIWAYICRLGDWLKILKLSAKLAHLYLEGRYLLFKLRILACQQRKLLIHKVNHVLGKTSSAGDADNLFGGVGSAHNNSGAKWPNRYSAAPRAWPHAQLTCLAWLLP